MESGRKRMRPAAPARRKFLSIARERGFATMESIVLANNVAMLRFAHALGFEVRPIEGDLATVRIERRLQRAATPAASARTPG